MSEIGIVDIREINKTIQNKYNLDFSVFALTSYRLRIERLMNHNNINNVDQLIKKLENNKDFFDDFLYELTVPSTEMFRDPSLWRWLRDDFLPRELEKSQSKFQIWLPNCVSGGELFSLTILLKECNLLNKVHIIASSLTNKSLENIKEGKYDLKKIEISTENYKRFQGKMNLKDYYRLERYHAYFDLSLIENVEFIKQDLYFDNIPENIKLIIFRNNFIYYTPKFQEEVQNKLLKSLLPGGHLIIGIKEKMINNMYQNEFELINQNENVYRKKLNI